MRYLAELARRARRHARSHRPHNIDELFAQIPEALKLRGRTESSRAALRAGDPGISSRRLPADSSRDYVSLLGAGAYSHYRPVAD